MFTAYTPDEIEKLKLAEKTKKEITIEKRVQARIIDVKYNDLNDDQKTLVQILKNVNLFKDLNERMLLDVVKFPSFVRYNRSDVILDKETLSNRIYCILSGSVQKVNYRSTTFANNRIYKKNELFNEATVITGIVETKIVYAIEDNTTIFAFELNSSLQQNSQYDSLYSVIFRRLAISIAKKYLA